MAKGPDPPDDGIAEPTVGMFAPDTERGDPPGRTDTLSPLPGNEGTASEFTEKDSTSQEITAASPSQKPEGEGVPTPVPPSGSGSQDSLAVHGMPEPGHTLFGNYLVERQLGGGAMGTVWLVRNLELDSLRALKLIVPSFAFDPHAQARFKREARVMARVKHPHAVTVHAARIGRDAAYIEMEYVSGKSLDRILQKGVPMPLHWTARVAAQLCEVLQEAHDNQVVHRDLKPSNMMLVDSLTPGKIQLKVLDFGIAKVLETDNSEVHTSTGQFMGTAQYTSPEQASGTEIDHRSDIYTVGVILYEMLTGARPFSGPIHQLIFGHLYSPPPPFSERNPAVSVSPEVEAIVLRCLAKNPDDRPQSALAVGEAFSVAVFGVYPPPAPQSDSWSVPLVNPGVVPRSVRSIDLPPTERAPEEGGQIVSPPWKPPQQSPYPSPQPVDKEVAVDDDWELPPPLTTFPEPGKPSRRKWLVLAVPIVAVLALACYFLIPRLFSGRRLPEGYKAEKSRDLVKSWPRVLVREADGARFIRIVGGTFMMGNDGIDKATSPDDEDQPAHPVTLSDFYMQETEVTNGEMEAYFTKTRMALEKRPKRWLMAVKKIDEAGRDPKQYPAVGVPHELAEQYARAMGGFLPAEAQWEYAARSQGKKRRFVWGDETPPDLTIANIDSYELIGSIYTTKVGDHPRDRTEQGILDLTGNVREWCRDVWAEYPASRKPLRDPRGPQASSGGKAEYVVRGGSFFTHKEDFRTTRPRRLDKSGPTSKQMEEDQTVIDLGFRIVIEWPLSP